MSVSERDARAGVLQQTLAYAREHLEAHPDGDQYDATIGSKRKGFVAILHEELDPIAKSVVEHFEADPRLRCDSAGDQVLHVELDDQTTLTDSEAPDR